VRPVTVKIGECVRCGRPVGIQGREHCARCHYALAHRPARNQCPGCSQPRKLDEVTGKCVLCSRTCVRCGRKTGRLGRDTCSLCLVKDRRAAAQQPCPRCGKPGRIREATGWCGHCSHPGRTPSPDAVCRACGLVTHLEGDGLCFPCYTRSPHRITIRAENLAARLSDPPRWLPGFADYLVPRHNATAACQMITDLGRLLRDGGPVHPQSLLVRAGARSGPLARALEDFFTSHGLALPPDHAERRAAGRRQRRLDAVPGSLRPAAIAFSEHELAGQQRAQRAGTRPPGHATVESHLASVRDFARFLTASRGITDWATMNTGDIEAFLTTQPATAAHRLAGLRRFFRFAASRRMVLTDPARTVTAARPWGFRGPSLTRDQQRELFRRWTSGRDGIHPHEALTGLLALIHGATTQQIRYLTVAAVDLAAQAATLRGRPQPTPLDPWTWTAVETCLAHRQALNSANPYLLVTLQTKATRAPSGDSYVKNILAPAGIRPRILRSSRMLALVNTADPKLVAAAYGMTHDAVTAYLADRVDLRFRQVLAAGPIGGQEPRHPGRAHAGLRRA
jgi:site-specific recombinase XerD